MPRPARDKAELDFSTTALMWGYWFGVLVGFGVGVAVMVLR